MAAGGVNCKLVGGRGAEQVCFKKRRGINDDDAGFHGKLEFLYITNARVLLRPLKQ